MKRFIGAEIVLGLLLLGLCFVPIFPHENEVPGLDTPRIIEETENKRVEYLGDNQYNTRIRANSKASMFLSPDNVEKFTWSDQGDGYIVLDGSNPTDWDYNDNVMGVGGGSGSYRFEIWLSFEIASTFQNTNNIKSIDDVDLMLKCESKPGVEGSEEVEIKKMGTNNQCGYGGDSDCNSYTEIFEFSRSGSKVVATSEFTAGVWENIDLTSQGWLSPGDQGQLNLYLEEDGFESNEEVIFYTGETANDPYLDIDYTLWSAPVANSGDITGEPSELLPGQNYEVQTIVTDADLAANLVAGYLYMSSDHSSYMVRFDWSENTKTFSQGLGSSYVDLNESDCSYATYGTTGYTLTWNFTVTRDWVENYMDWGNYATDAQGKNSGLNWNNENSWYTDKLWLHTLNVEWIAESTYLEDGDYITTSESLNITGYYYWNQITTAYDLTFGTPRAELVVDGVNNGTYYNCSLDAAGYFNISYTTPAAEDWDWSLDVVLDNIPTGMSEGTSNDNGKNPLFLTDVPSAVFGTTGASVTISIEPEDYNHTFIMRRTLNYTTVMDVVTMELPYTESNVTISNIPTGYSFSHQQMGHCESTGDNIAAAGIYKLVNITSGLFELWFNTGFTWHETTFSPTLPDMLAGEWAHYQWYMNETHITQNPYPLTHGFYYLLVKDSFQQTILSANYTIASSDTKRLQVSKVVPMYPIGIKSKDNASYYLEIERGDFTMNHPLPPNGDVHFRIYGLITPINYTVFVKRVSDDSEVGNFTLSVPDHAVSRSIDYLADDLALMQFEGIKWVSESLVGVFLTTNWENCTIQVSEQSSTGTVVKLAAAAEGALSWTGNMAGEEITVTFLVDGGTQNFTLIDRYYYVRAEPTPGGVAQITKILEPRDFILPAFFLLGGFALISSFNSRRTAKKQSRKEWRETYLTHKGVTHSSQLSPYERRKFHEAEEHRFGKSRFRRKKA